MPSRWLILTWTLLVAVSTTLAVADHEGASEETQVDTARIEAALSLWEYGHEEFNQLVRLSQSDIGRFQGLLRAAATERRRRSLAVLLALNCALPGKHHAMATLQEYRCTRLAYSRFERWATSTRGGIYVLAFAKPADRRAAIRVLRAKLRAANALPYDDVEGKEFLAELVGYLEEGGLP